MQTAKPDRALMDKLRAAGLRVGVVWSTPVEDDVVVHAEGIGVAGPDAKTAVLIIVQTLAAGGSTVFVPTPPGMEFELITELVGIVAARDMH